MENQYVILVSPRDNEVQLVKEKGYKIILLRKEISFDEIFDVDIPVEIDLNDEEAVLEKCLQLTNQLEVISVFTMNEYRIPLASKISEMLQLKYQLPYEASLRCRNKKMARQKLNEAGVGEVQYRLVTSDSNLESQLQGMDFPLIVKPSNDSGSKNVYLCKNESEITTAIKHIVKSKKNIVGQTIDSDILIEEFLDGPEFSIESVTANGQTTIIGITKKLVTPYPLSIEVGHDFPANLNTNEENEIKRLVEQSLAALDVDFAVTHTEVKLTEKGPRIVEVNARPGGDEIPHLVKAVTGVDLKALAFLVTLGKGIDSIDLSSSTVPSASIRFLLANKEGKVYFDEQFQSASIKEQKWYVNDGESVQRTESNFNRLGYFIVYGDEQSPSCSKADSVEKELSITIKNPLEI
ncbi:ATP-grasp domain-containing protein [Priestia megaterium]|uniref:ATP-grasp domain-containing protein n=1 Tax=Priestia megaterium TaxID=1404 RepID=UPI000D51253E|nr:ATP-grasp domain-containing protein [Priestia megaterium]PVE64385.1 phosphoribosylglycinamide synthetase [Priestia megaterium]PVE79949.1 phosphoribosylglycinamide synthetase [Priestia megaterium]PVE83739.1 phosphoribosylglycinamide synthetase [Priestia megaterium]PVE99465.1 phosphoribosylglycinamide synthetase [Priestia megaterium]